MGQYSIKGLYNSYKKNNKEREVDDYYATPTLEVLNILETTCFDFTDKTILEPCCGGGHMVEGIEEYLKKYNDFPKEKIATDYKNRGFVKDGWKIDYGFDFLSDEYPVDKADIVIMNPPYSLLEPFFIRALEIAQSKLIVLCRTQALEGEGRYTKIFKENPPTDIYQYVDRIHCWKNGEKPETTSAQAYCWLVWDKFDSPAYPRFHWIRRSDKN